MNGDGHADVAVGAWQADPNSNDSAGETYVIFGQPGAFAAAVDLNALDGSNGFRIDGIDAGDFSGYSVSSAGDVNNDGFGDLAIVVSVSWKEC